MVAMLNVEVAEPPEVRDTVSGFNDSVGPRGDTVAARFTLPAKLF